MSVLVRCPRCRREYDPNILVHHESFNRSSDPYGREFCTWTVPGVGPMRNRWMRDKRGEPEPRGTARHGLRPVYSRK